MQKVIVFDIDGTIYNPYTDQICDSAKYALKKLSDDKNNILVIASGRPSYNLHAIESIRHYFNVIISFNGSLIEYDNKIIYKNVLSDDELNNLANFYEEKNLVHGVQAIDYEGIMTNEKCYLDQFNKINLPVPNYIKSLRGLKNVVQTYFFSDNISDMEGIEGFRIVPWYEAGADLLKTNTSKLSAINYLLDHLGLNEHDIYCFGDGENDYEMLKTYPNTACMGNGASICKDVAKYVSSHIDDGGLYEAIKYFNLIEE